MECVHVVKSTNDKRTYLRLVLPNELTVLLISDPETDKASAAMDVGVGHFQDPEELPGLAHFCEHMLFLGTEKYPDEDSYNNYLASHGGSSNAYTSMEHTNYYFDVSPDHLEGALDIFAQFFIAPLFTEGSTAREMKAVDSENSKNLNDDTWRLFQLLKSTANPAHPFHKFGTGNLVTLGESPGEAGINTREALLEFHRQYYSANQMQLVVLGKEPLVKLREWVTSLFSAAENRCVTLPECCEPPFLAKNLAARYFIESVKDVRQLELYFPFPGIGHHYRKKPERYISHLIGHEGPGSILALLKAKGWGHTLSAGGHSQRARDFTYFTIKVKLTPEGLTRVDDVIGVIFDYISLMRATGPQEWVFNECKRVGEMDFQFQDKANSMDYTKNLSAAMRWYAAEDALSGGYLFHEFDPALISKLVELLNPRNLRAHVVSQTCAEGAWEAEEPWYGTKYRHVPFSEESLTAWERPVCSEGALHLPAPNEFIPDDLELLVPPEAADEIRHLHAHPELVHSTTHAAVYFKPDTTFFTPRSAMYLAVISPAANESPLSAATTLLFAMVAKDALNEYAYAADIAGLSFTLSADTRGLLLRVGGYSQKLPLLAETIVFKLARMGHDVAPDRFAHVKAKLVQDLENSLGFGKTYTHSQRAVSEYLLLIRWPLADQLSALRGLTLDAFRAFVLHLLARHRRELLLVGNSRCEDALAVEEACRRAMSASSSAPPLSDKELPTRRVVRLEDREVIVFRQKEPNPVESNSAIYQYYQIGGKTLQMEAMCMLLRQCIRDKAFDQLRTKEQLGYIVWTNYRDVFGVMGLRFIIQSKVADPPALDSRVEAFVLQFRELLAAMSEAEFTDFQRAAVTVVLQKDKTIWQEAGRHWAEIDSHTFVYDRATQLAELIPRIRREELLWFYDEYIGPTGAKRAKFVAWTFGSGTLGDEGQFGADDEVQRLVAAEANLLESPTDVTVLTEGRTSAAQFQKSMSVYPPFV